MWLRGATSSLLVSFLFAYAYFWFVENQTFSQAFQENLIFLALFFFLGIYTSSMIIVYGKQIKRRMLESISFLCFSAHAQKRKAQTKCAGEKGAHFAAITHSFSQLRKSFQKVNMVPLSQT